MATGTVTARADELKTSEQVEKDKRELDEQIRCLAYQIWRANGSPVGTYLSDWLEAEAQILGEAKDR